MNAPATNPEPNEKNAFWRFFWFTMTRNIGTLVDCLVLWFFADLVFKGSYVGENIVSPTISFEVATLVNYITSYFWIYRSRIPKGAGKRAFARRFLTFNLSSVFGFLIKMGFLLLFEHLFSWHVVVCNLLALCISGLFNYFFADLWVFGKKKPRPQHELLTKEELAGMSRVFRGRFGQKLATFMLKIFGIDRLNRLYDSCADAEGVNFAHRLLEQMGCDYLVGNAERLGQLPQGAFITISNHPYGGLDGIVLVDLIGRCRPDYKVMVNDILSRIAAMAPSFITVNPRTKNDGDVTTTSIRGVREVLHHVGQGHPVGFFPSGAVSDLHRRTHDIADREWQEGLIRLIQRQQVPIVPVRFYDRNSRFFYRLGLIDWKVRVLRLPRELFNKGKGQHRLAIGDVITVEQQQAFSSVQELGRYLRSAVYDLPLPDMLVPASCLTIPEPQV